LVNWKNILVYATVSIIVRFRWGMVNMASNSALLAAFQSKFRVTGV
jgi:hypothetical protein